MDLSSFAGAFAGLLGADDHNPETPGVKTSTGRVAPLRKIRESLPAFQAELNRARRYEHPVALVLITLDEPGSDAEAGSGGPGQTPRILETKVPQLVSLLVASLVEDSLRASDIMSYSPAQDRYVLLLTESDARDAHGAVARLQSLIAERAMLQVRIGIAEFPADGLTLGDLLRVAERAWQQGEEPKPSAEELLAARPPTNGGPADGENG